MEDVAADRVTMGAKRLRARLVRTLVRSGLLTDPAWRKAFLEVPRHAFLPRFFQPEAGRWAAVASTDPGWLTRIYADRVLVTQLDGDSSRWARARGEGPLPGTPTCSSSMPTIMAVMLQALRTEEGHRVLEIGTGTGYNAALLCHRLGDSMVSTVDVDGEIVEATARRLLSCGYRPTCVVTDGARGYPAGAPYDRVLCTCAVSEIPLDWLEQTVPGGLVVTTLNRPLGAGMVRLTAGEGATGFGRVLADDGRFMPLRAHRAAGIDELVAGLREAEGRTRNTELDRATVVNPASPFEFFAGLELPGAAPATDQDGATVLVHPDGSWAQAGTTQDEEHQVTQGGPRALWDEAEAAHQRWLSLGQPRRARFGITVTPLAQELWLDRPNSTHRWSLLSA